MHWLRSKVVCRVAFKLACRAVCAAASTTTIPEFVTGRPEDQFPTIANAGEPP